MRGASRVRSGTKARSVGAACIFLAGIAGVTIPTSGTQGDLPTVVAAAERGPMGVVSLAMLALVFALLWLVRTLVIDIRPALGQVVSSVERLAEIVEAQGLSGHARKRE